MLLKKFNESWESIKRIGHEAHDKLRAKRIPLSDYELEAEYKYLQELRAKKKKQDGTA